MRIKLVRHNYLVTDDPINNHITKEIHMTNKQKVLVARMLRTLVATFIGLAAAWLAGPNGVDLIEDPQARSFVVMVVVPTLITLDKMLRYGRDEGEE